MQYNSFNEKQYYAIQLFGYSFNMTQQSVCLVIIPITVDNFVPHFKHHNDGSGIRLLIKFGWATANLSVAWPIEVELIISFATLIKKCVYDHLVYLVDAEPPESHRGQKSP